MEGENLVAWRNDLYYLECVKQNNLKVQDLKICCVLKKTYTDTRTSDDIVILSQFLQQSYFDVQSTSGRPHTEAI